MKKLVVAAVVLGLVGVAAAGVFHVRRSVCDGVCPLTGEPIAANAAPAAMSMESSSTGSGLAAESCPSAGAQRCSEAAAEHCSEVAAKPDCANPCEDETSLEDCKKKMECSPTPAEPVQKP